MYVFMGMDFWLISAHKIAMPHDDSYCRCTPQLAQGESVIKCQYLSDGVQ